MKHHCIVHRKCAKHFGFLVIGLNDKSEDALCGTTAIPCRASDMTGRDLNHASRIGTLITARSASV